jgi:hypothetical protein
MKQMIERSSALYADLQTRYRQVCSDLEAEKKKKVSSGISKKVIILSEHESLTLNDDGTFTTGDVLQKYPPGVAIHDFRQNTKEMRAHEGAPPGQPLLKMYMKGVLLEFFIADAATQHQLIPVMLQLLECPPEQIAAAQRGFAEGKQIIAKAAAAFGL